MAKRKSSSDTSAAQTKVATPRKSAPTKSKTKSAATGAKTGAKKSSAVKPARRAAAKTATKAAGKTATKPRTKRSTKATTKAASKPAARSVRVSRPSTPVYARPIEPTYDQISQRAYQIWVNKGQPAGLDEENWRQAEQELRSELRT